MKIQYDPFCYWRMIWLLLLLMISVPAVAMAECDYEPDAVDCPCFSEGGVWDPSGGYIQDVADQTFGTVVSCTCCDPGDPSCDWDPWPLDPDKNFVNSGKPYYQMVLGCDEPFTAFSMAVAIAGGMGDFEGRTAWCTETVSYWHKHAHIPYPEGYRTDWHQDWQVYCAADLVYWYIHESLLENGRGRWISWDDISYEDIELGINLPVPGAYVPIRGLQLVHPVSDWYDCEWLDWETGHSLMVNEMWIHTDILGSVCRVEVTLQEGNSGTPPRVRHDRTWGDILDLTPGGASWIGDRKIYGFGIDLDGNGNPIYDPARLHWVSESGICSPPGHRTVTTIDPQWDEQQFQKMATYASLIRSEGGPKVQCSSGSLKIDGIPDGANTEWHFPAGLTEEVEIIIDLLYGYPVPIRGIEIRWDGGSLPLGYSVEFAGADGEYHEAVVPDLSLLGQFQFHPKEYPVSCTFDPGGAVDAVRFVKVIFPEGTFAADAVLKELRFRYDTGSPEDAQEHPEGTHLGPDCANAYAEPMYLWSPNHKFQKIQIKGVTDPEGSPVNIKIASITQDEPVSGLGDGDKVPDGIIENETTAWVRAERSGDGNGRVYEIKFIASDAEGGSSIGSVNVMVQLNKEQQSLDDGQYYDSTQQP